MTLDLARIKSLHAAAAQGEIEAPEWNEGMPQHRGGIGIRRVEDNETVAHVYYHSDAPDGKNGASQKMAFAKLLVALHNAAPSLIARAELLEWLIREMQMLPEAEHGDAGGVVLYDEYIAPWMDEIEKRYREMEADHD